MIIHSNDTYMKSCLQAWLFCESCIHAEITTDKPRKNLVKECHDCARACFSVVASLAGNRSEVSEQTLNCILQCRRAQEECEKYAYVADIKYCGEVCKNCADQIKELLVLNINLN
jgi:hypothetical protein